MKATQQRMNWSRCTALNGTPPPLKMVPAFQPLMFKQDKFLSIKSRSAETWVDTCCDISSRSRVLDQKINVYLNLNHVPSTTATSVSINISERDLPPEHNAALRHVESLPSHLAEELHHINKKAQNLTTIQGFVLSDELVFDMFHINVISGDYNTGLTLWLQSYILGDEQRGPPYPLFFLQDLVTILGVYLMSTLPESATNLHVFSAFPTGRNLCGLGTDRGELHKLLEHGWRSPRPHRWHANISVADKKTEDCEPDWYTPLLYTNSYNCYTRYYLRNYLLWVWCAAGKMNLFFDELRGNIRLSSTQSLEDEEDVAKHDNKTVYAEDGNIHPKNAMGGGRIGGVLPFVKEQNAVVRRLLMSFVPTKSTITCGPDTNDILMPLRVITELLVSLAACAAEAKEPWLLLLLQNAFCSGFLTHSRVNNKEELGGNSNGSHVVLNTEAWIGYLDELGSDVSATLVPQARDIIDRFSLDIISLVNHGRQAFRSEQQLWAAHDALRLIAAAKRHYQQNASSSRSRTAADYESRGNKLNREGSAFKYHVRFFNMLWSMVSATLRVPHNLEGEEAVKDDDVANNQVQEHLWDETSALISSYLSGLSTASEAVMRTMLYVGYGCQDSTLIHVSDPENHAIPTSSHESENTKSSESHEGSGWALLERTLLLNNLQHQQRLALLCSFDVGDSFSDASPCFGSVNEVNNEVESAIWSYEWLVELKTALKAHKDRGVSGNAAEVTLLTLDSAHLRQIVDSLAERLVCLTLIDVAQWLRTNHKKFCHDQGGCIGGDATCHHIPQHQFDARKEKGVDSGKQTLSSDNNNEAQDSNEDFERYDAVRESRAPHETENFLDRNEHSSSDGISNAEHVAEAMLFESLQTLRLPITLHHRVELLLGELKSVLGNRPEGETLPPSLSWCSCVSPAAVSVLAVLLGGFSTDCAPHTEGEPQASHRIWDDLVDITMYHLSPFHNRVMGATEDSKDNGVAAPLSSLFGNSISILLLMLARTAQWDLAERLLRGLEASNRGNLGVGEHSQPHNSEGDTRDGGVRWLWSGLTVGPEIFSEVFSRAREDGATVVCAMLSPNRKRIFF